MKWLTVGIVTILCIGFFAYITKDYEIADKFLNRYTTTKTLVKDSSDGRIQIGINGLKKLSLFEWWMGAGLTSVIVSGPHNDYIRWTQRIGIPMMFFGFFPFFIAFIKSIRLARSYRVDNTLFVFLTLVIGFTLFHSLFGYPREDANQAVAAYLGLALWFGAYRERLILNIGQSLIYKTRLLKQMQTPPSHDHRHSRWFD